MDRNTVIGIILIAAIFIGYSILSKPTEEQREAAERIKDSLEQEYIKQLEEKRQDELSIQQQKDTLEVLTTDTISKETLVNMYGSFSQGGQGTTELLEVENELMKIKFSNKGGKIYSVELKNYQTYDSHPLVLFNGDSTVFGLNFFAENKQIATNDLYFTHENNKKYIKVSDKPETISYRLYAGEYNYIEYRYTLHPNSYMLDFDIELVGLNNVLPSNVRSLDIAWELYALSQEKGKENENNFSTIVYKFYQDEVDELSARGKDAAEEELRTKVRWIAFKQHFFSSALIAKDYFLNTFIEYEKIDNSEKFLKLFSAALTVPYNSTNKETIPLQMFFGPNHYKTLKKFDLELEEQVTLGKSIIRWVNVIVIIPIFNFLSKYIESYGIIILLLTIIIKLVLYPLTFKSYLSTAKMRVLKPQLDELNKKFSKREDAMKKQQATMALYKKAGVNPLGGCLPMLLQFPILIAMFRFFPSSIELRQQSFLWAHDLSTYDSVLDLPFNIPMYGDHISLFTLLMTVATVISMKISNQAASTSTQMPGMKTMMYFMPIMFMFVLNNYSAGLTYYYFLANMITIGQNALSKRFIDDEALLKKIQQNVKKAPKKSKFQERLEKAAKQRGYKR